MPDPVLDFAPSVDPSQMSAYTRGVLLDNAARSGNPRLLASSLQRTPRHQAEAMHDNLVQHGVAAQRALYKAPGNLVIDVFVHDLPLSKESTLQDMTAKIVEVGPATVSKHCADPIVLGVTDCANSALLDKAGFVTALRADPRVSLVLDEPYNGCVHIEVPQTPNGPRVAGA